MISKEILVIYPKVDQTKIAVYRNINVIFLKTIKHKEEELAQFKKVMDQVDFRTSAILTEIKENDLNLEVMEAVVARGGLIKPLKVAGVYEVNELMIKHLKEGYQGMHETNMGGIIADKIAKQLPNAKAFLADPVVVDELDDIARVTGHPEFERKSIFHALNHKYIGRKFAKSNNKCYFDMRMIIAHIGSGGTSIGAHKGGKVIDVNQAFDGAGPYSLNRTGTLPTGKLVDSGDEKARFYMEAMAYNIAKHIGSMAAALDFNVDAVLLSGSIFNYPIFTDYLSEKIKSIAPLAIFPTVNDMDALASNTFLAMKGEVDVHEYK